MDDDYKSLGYGLESTENDLTRASELCLMKNEETKEVANPFARCSEMLRSPDLGASRKQVRVVETGSLAEQALSEPGNETYQGKESAVAENLEEQVKGLERRILEAEKIENNQLEAMSGVLQTMRSATTKQRNVSMDIKNGLESLTECIEAIRESKEVPRPKEETPLDTPEPKDPKKRSREKLSSPEEGPGRTPLPEWVTVDRRKKKKKMTPRTPQANTPLVGKQAREAEEPPNKRMTAPSGERPEGTKKALTSKSQPRRIKPRPDAIMIKPAEGRTYAEILGKIRQDTKPENSGTEVRSVRKTRGGQVLLEVQAKPEDKQAFSGLLRDILGEMAVVQDLEHKETLEIRDLDEMTSEEEVKEAIAREVKDFVGELKIHVTKADGRGQKVAIVEINVKAAEHLLDKVRIRVGWVYGRVRRRAYVPRCYRCLCFGHLARACRGPDRKGVCFGCGVVGHPRKECDRDPRCLACTELQLEGDQLKHALGSGGCLAFRKALEEAKRKLR